MAKRHGRRRDQDMGQLLAEQEASGLSVAAFARERGLSAWTLYASRRRLRERDRREKGEETPFVQVRVRQERASASSIAVELAGGARVHVPLGFDEGELRRLLGVLASC